MKTTWKGNYKFDSEKLQRAVGYPHTYFTIELDHNEDDTFTGIVQDDIQSGGMPEQGLIRGEMHNDLIYFEKHMPILHEMDRHGNMTFNEKEKHHLLIYTGKMISPNKYSGTWKFEKKWVLLFWFIPYPLNLGNGTWEMEILVDNSI